MPPAFPDAQLRRAGISAARVAQLQATYNAMDTWQQQRFRSVVASAPDEVLRRTYDPAGVPDVPVTPAQVAGDPAMLTAVQAAILAAHDTDAERETFVPARLSAAAITAASDARYRRMVLPQINKAWTAGTWNRNATDALTSQSSYAVIGIDTTADMPYCLDSGNGVLRLCTAVNASNQPTAWSSAKTFPTGTSWYNAVRLFTFKGRLYLLTVQDSTGRPAIYSAAPTTGNTVLTWDAAPLLVGTAGSTARPTNFVTDGNYLYYGDYGDPTGGPRLFRSTDGTTWTTIQTFTGIRHIHALGCDPYNPGHVWAVMGDGVANPNRFSTDNGATFTNFPAVNGDQVQVTALGFGPSYVWATDDTAYLTAITFDRTTKAWSGACASFHGFIPHPAPRTATTFYDGVTNGTTTFASATASFVSPTGAPFDPTDQGKAIRGPGIPAGTTITSVTNATTVVMSAPATTTATAVTFTVDRAAQKFAPAVFYGALDAAQDIFYMTTQQSSMYPDGALFAVMGRGGQPVLVDFGNIGNAVPYLWRDRVFYGPFNRRAFILG